MAEIPLEAADRARHDPATRRPALCDGPAGPAPPARPQRAAGPTTTTTRTDDDESDPTPIRLRLRSRAPDARLRPAASTSARVPPSRSVPDRPLDPPEAACRPWRSARRGTTRSSTGRWSIGPVGRRPAPRRRPGPRGRPRRPAARLRPLERPVADQPAAARPRRRAARARLLGPPDRPGRRAPARPPRASTR